MHVPGWIAGGYFVFTIMNPTCARLRFSRLLCIIQGAFLGFFALGTFLFGSIAAGTYFYNTKLKVIPSYMVFGTHDIVKICVWLSVGLMLASFSYHSFSTAKVFKALCDRYAEKELQLPTVQYYDPPRHYERHIQPVDRPAFTGYPDYIPAQPAQYYTATGYPAPVQTGYSFAPQITRVM